MHSSNKRSRHSMCRHSILKAGPVGLGVCACTGQAGWGTASVQSGIDTTGPGIGCSDLAGIHSCIAGVGRVGVYSHTGMAGRDAAGTQSCIGYNDTAGPGVNSCTAGIASAGRVGAAPDTRCIGMVGAHAHTGTTGAVGPCVHAVIVCIGIDDAYTGPARVAVNCVAACRMCTDSRSIDKAGTVCVDATGMQSVAYTGATGMQAGCIHTD